MVRRRIGEEVKLGSQLIEPMLPSICYSHLDHSIIFPKESLQSGRQQERRSRRQHEANTCSVLSLGSFIRLVTKVPLFEFCSLSLANHAHKHLNKVNARISPYHHKPVQKKNN